MSKEIIGMICVLAYNGALVIAYLVCLTYLIKSDSSWGWFAGLGFVVVLSCLASIKFHAGD